MAVKGVKMTKYCPKMTKQDPKWPFLTFFRSETMGGSGPLCVLETFRWPLFKLFCIEFILDWLELLWCKLLLLLCKLLWEAWRLEAPEIPLAKLLLLAESWWWWADDACWISSSCSGLAIKLNFRTVHSIISVGRNNKLLQLNREIGFWARLTLEKLCWKISKTTKFRNRSKQFLWTYCTRSCWIFSRPLGREQRLPRRVWNAVEKSWMWRKLFQNV